MFCALLIGSVLYCLVMVCKVSATAHNIAVFMVSFPMSMLLTLLDILLNLTANQRKFSELLRKLKCIDKVLLKYNRSRTRSGSMSKWVWCCLF